MRVSDRGAPRAAASLAFTNHQLHKFWTLPVSFVLASFLVDLVNFIMTAAKSGQTFQTHLVQNKCADRLLSGTDNFLRVLLSMEAVGC